MVSHTVYGFLFVVPAAAVAPAAALEPAAVALFAAISANTTGFLWNLRDL
jgi:hypothetical protein